ncbi:glutathione S-transferase family protein [Bosea sp. 124]|uniref:glutathione S-transferase family protein n=1 Tax=Bosea sp. 124 TaxID=2135642 RepID=UPI000D383E5C|nr:glutathione S-transferase family protein [Bosea sp. 124]PTM38552.1 glutathione S-transferase [Bosea sp. 124]
MSLQLYAHPFSSYCQKVLVALYENDTPFTYRLLGLDDPQAGEELAALWPLKRFPVLVDGPETVIESSIIIEHLALSHPGPSPLLPAGAKAALAVRMMDRFFDNYVMTPMQKIVFDHIREPQDRDPHGVADARAMLDAAYQWLDARLAGREWACGDDFGMADCAAAPSLFYADWVHEIDVAFPNTRAYRARLLTRPSFARAVDEGRPYRHFFPPGAPDRD